MVTDEVEAVDAVLMTPVLFNGFTEVNKGVGDTGLATAKIESPNVESILFNILQN